MDSETTRRKRLEDIDAKRKRLEEMRKSRAPSAVSSIVTADVTHASPKRNEERDRGPSSDGFGSNISTSYNINLDSTNELVNSLLQNSQSIAVVESNVVPTKSREELLNERIQCFSTIKNISNTVSILPLIPVTYDKGIQTVGTDDDSSNNQIDNKDSQQVPETIYPLSSTDEAMDVKLTSTSTSSTMDPAALTPINLTDTQLSTIIQSKEFVSFLNKSSLLIERAISISQSHIDLLKDFSVDDSQEDNYNNSSDKILQLTSSSYNSDGMMGRPVMDLRWSHLIPDLFLVAYGSKIPSSSSSSINSSSSNGRGASSSSFGLGNPEDIPGLLCVWSKDLHTRPEFRFIASSPILTALFHTTEQHIILGACYSGQILLWDMRTVHSGKSNSSRELPLQRSSITGRGHKQPVYAMAMITSTNTSLSSTASIMHELLSVSTDGLLCRWDTTRLVEPLSYSFLFADMGTPIRSSLLSFNSIEHNGGGLNNTSAIMSSSQMNICAMAVRSIDGSHDEANNEALFGSGSGLLIRSAVPLKEGGTVTSKIEGHAGLITSIQMHPSRNSKYSSLVLTSSLDWTVKLWDLAGDDATFTKPLIEFSSSSYDYVCDVQWSLVNPAVFVTLTSGGKVSLWNLGKSITEPVDVLVLETSSKITSSSALAVVGIISRDDLKKDSKIALNKAIWTRDGQSILVGDSVGTLHVIKVLSSSSSASALSSVNESLFESALVSRRTGTQQVAENTMESPIPGDDGMTNELYANSLSSVKDTLEEIPFE